MRISPFKERLAGLGATFRQRYGTEVVAQVAGRQTEYLAVRNRVGLTDFSFVRSYRLPSEQGLDFLDALSAGNVPRIRYGRVLHTFLADEDGRLTGDCYIANNDEELIFLCESIIADSELNAVLQAAGATAANLEDLTETHVLLSVDGYQAWKVVKELFGADVLGLPYLSIEMYPFEDATVRLLRAGKTSEFGYLLLAPRAIAPALFEKALGLTTDLGGCLCGVDAHEDLRLTGRFFNIHAEGLRVRDPLVLGLQWMIDFEKEKFRGSAAIQQRRAAGLRHKIIGLAAEPGCDQLKTGARIYSEGQLVAETVADGYCPELNQRLGLAVFPVELAYAGLEFQHGDPAGPLVRSISMPPIMPKSLTVKLDEL
jgi:aminomethyltransferase